MLVDNFISSFKTEWAINLSPLQDSHVPLTCDEVEKDSEVRARTLLENVATEAMIRQCPKCSNRFYKEDGCNKMKCSCGQSMCYLCRAAVPDSYSHFYGQG